MKYFIGIFIGLVVLMLLFLAVGKLYDSEVDTFQPKKKQVKEEKVEDKKLVPPHKVVKKVLPKPLPKKKKKAISKIPKDVRPYLQDDTFELKENMTLVQVDKIWGTPATVERTYNSNDKKMLWTYGEYWSSRSKLKGLFYYKTVRFENGKLSYWTKAAIVKIKTHNRLEQFKSHLDETGIVKKGYSKTEVYKLWGLPSLIDVKCYSNKSIRTQWYFSNKDGLSHYVVFENNKAKRWGDY
jgi:hypothetical protein